MSDQPARPEPQLEPLWGKARALSQEIELPADPIGDGTALVTLQARISDWRRRCLDLQAVSTIRTKVLKRKVGWARRLVERSEALWSSTSDDETKGKPPMAKKWIVRRRLGPQLDELAKLEGLLDEWQGLADFMSEVSRAVGEAKELLRQQTDWALSDRYRIKEEL